MVFARRTPRCVFWIPSVLYLENYGLLEKILCLCTEDLYGYEREENFRSELRPGGRLVTKRAGGTPYVLFNTFLETVRPFLQVSKYRSIHSDHSE